MLDRRRCLIAIVGGAAAAVTPRTPAGAVVQDETARWAMGDVYETATNFGPSSKIPQVPSDEIVIDIPVDELSSSGLGLELSEIEFRTNRRVFVKSVVPSSLAAKLGIKKEWVLVKVNNASAERTDAQGVQIMVKDGIKNKSLQITFRDPSFFLEKLRNGLAEGDVVTTQVAPEGDTTQRATTGKAKGEVTSQEDQRITVTQIKGPTMCKRGAQVGDLLEVSYIARVLETDEIFDGSGVSINGSGRSVAGRGGDVSLFFVLGKQPFGQFPPGWDVGLEGICVGERRRLIIPPVLAYGNQGVPRRRIPPNATLQYDVTLVSINGNALPQ